MESFLKGLQNLAYSRIVVTSEWLICTSNYDVIFARIADKRLVAIYVNQSPVFLYFLPYLA